MTKPREDTHAIARQLVAAGHWRVDPDTGLVHGKRGAPFTRRNTDGYIQIKFRDPLDYRHSRYVLAHRVIWEAIHGPLDQDLTINHMNGIKHDNRLINLEAITLTQNIRHALDTGLKRIRRGTETARAVLTGDQVRDIYARAWHGQNQSDIGNLYGVSHMTVSNIKHGYNWSHVTLAPPARGTLRRKALD
jgi:HNH endonuclease